MISDCANSSCRNKATHGKMFCDPCSTRLQNETLRVPVTSTLTAPMPSSPTPDDSHTRRANDTKMSFRYPKYYKEVPAGVTELDIYMVCHIFQVQDGSGAIHHAIKKLLLPGVRTGGKSRRDDIKEARDTLNRWLEINK